MVITNSGYKPQAFRMRNNIGKNGNNSFRS